MVCQRIQMPDDFKIESIDGPGGGEASVKFRFIAFNTLLHKHAIIS